MNAQEPGRAPDGSIDNLRHPPGTETAELGTLGAVVRRGSGPLDILLIPGSAFGAEAWASFMERNADRYIMWAVSLPGYGRTDPPPMPSWADLPATPWLDGAQAALRRLISEEMDRPVVVGHHLEGDYHALRLALEYSEQISGVVVMAGNPRRLLVRRPLGAALEPTDLNMVRVARIETSSFSPADGIAVGSSPTHRRHDLRDHLLAGRGRVRGGDRRWR